MAFGPLSEAGAPQGLLIPLALLWGGAAVAVSSTAFPAKFCGTGFRQSRRLRAFSPRTRNPEGRKKRRRFVVVVFIVGGLRRLSAPGSRNNP